MFILTSCSGFQQVINELTHIQRQNFSCIDLINEPTHIKRQSSSCIDLINEPTHIQRQSFSCIDLVFTDQPNLSINLGIHISLHPDYHHQIVQLKLDLNIFYPSPYQHLVWH